MEPERDNLDLNGIIGLRRDGGTQTGLLDLSETIILKRG